MSLWILLEEGMSMPSRETWGGRVTLWCGRRLALRHRRVEAASSSLIHPEARIHPREGRITIGAHTTIAAGAIIQGNVRFGDHCSVQANSFIVGYGNPNDSEGGIFIGNHVRIASFVMMVGADHVFERTDVPISRQGLCYKRIVIEDDVWIAGRVNIAAGVRIGRGGVVAAGAVVTRDVPPWTVVGGVPARVLKKRDHNTICP